MTDITTRWGRQVFETRQRAADWHGVQAVKAYRRKDYEAFTRHIKIADKLWREGR